MKPVFVILVPFCWTWVYGGRVEELLGKRAFSRRKSLFLLSPIARFAADSGPTWRTNPASIGQQYCPIAPGGARMWSPALGGRRRQTSRNPSQLLEACHARG